EAYEHDNPNVTIDFQEIPYSSYNDTIKSRKESGTLPDIFITYPASMSKFVNDGYVRDLYPLVSDDTTVFEDYFSKNLLVLFSVDGKLTGIPTATVSQEVV